MSWVMVTAVAPISVTISRISALMTPDMIGSSPVVGSSKKMIFGSAAMARAKRHALLHPAGQFGREQVGHLRPHAHPAQLVQRDLAGLVLGPLHRAAQQAEGDVFPHPQRIEQRARPGTACRTAPETHRGRPWSHRAPRRVIVPLSGRTSPSTHFSSTDLPVPDPPITTSEAPWAPPA
jgi:hypothetical protein